MELTTTQGTAVDRIAEWVKSYHKGASVPQVFRLFGFAGTGKTTLARHVAEALGRDAVHFAAYTGKATDVLRRSGCPQATTIHQFVYKPVGEKLKNGKYTPIFEAKGGNTGPLLKLVVLDECSMLNRYDAENLLRLELPVLVLGDPGQLPPVKGSGYFTHSEEYPVDTPDVMLTEVHRQAEESPVLQLATLVRNGRVIRSGTYGTSTVLPSVPLHEIDINGYDQIICGRNKTRNAVNNLVRCARGIEDPLPVVGDRVVCLDNSYDHGVLNGQTFMVQEILPNESEKADEAKIMTMRLVDATIGKEVVVPAWKACFQGKDMDEIPYRFRKAATQFDFGYALTAHKAQGSQFDSVIILDESRVFHDMASRWLYTAITRAASRVLVSSRYLG